jgi:hypothetical protein
MCIVHDLKRRVEVNARENLCPRYRLPLPTILVKNSQEKLRCSNNERSHACFSRKNHEVPPSGAILPLAFGSRKE